MVRTVRSWCCSWYFNSSAMLKNNQLVLLLPVEIFNNVTFIYIYLLLSLFVFIGPENAHRGKSQLRYLLID